MKVKLSRRMRFGEPVQDVAWKNRRRTNQLTSMHVNAAMSILMAVSVAVEVGAFTPGVSQRCLSSRLWCGPTGQNST